jgi:hypothetical protein
MNYITSENNSRQYIEILIQIIILIQREMQEKQKIESQQKELCKLEGIKADFHKK